jgi:hypothetical protein
MALSICPGPFYSFRTFAFAIFAAIALKLGLLFCTAEKSTSLHLGVIDVFFQELCPLNKEKFKNFSIFWIS